MKSGGQPRHGTFFCGDTYSFRPLKSGGQPRPHIVVGLVNRSFRPLKSGGQPRQHRQRERNQFSLRPLKSGGQPRRSAAMGQKACRFRPLKSGGQPRSSYPSQTVMGVLGAPPRTIDDFSCRHFHLRLRVDYCQADLYGGFSPPAARVIGNLFGELVGDVWAAEKAARRWRQPRRPSSFSQILMHRGHGRLPNAFPLGCGR